MLPMLLWVWGALAASPPLPPASITLQLLLTTLFPEAGPAASEGMALLRDLETHYLDFRTSQIRFLQPWARKGLTPKELQDLEAMIRNNLADFIRWMKQVVKEQGKGYPFVTQFSAGCELHPNGTLRPFCAAGMDGEDFISLDVAAGTWVTQSGDKLALSTRDILNYNKVVIVELQFLLRTTCVNEIQAFVNYGKESLERRERPVAVVFARAAPPARTPTQFLLVCRVTGFYPRPIRVAWLQDGEEVTSGWRLNATGILPNADLTYQLRSSLAVEPGDGHSYACQVEHISLGGQSLLIPWNHGSHWGLGLIVGIILGVLAIASVVMLACWSRRRGYQDVAGVEPRA